MSQSKSQTLYPPPAAHLTLRRRILRMSTAWAALGAVMGASVGLEGGGINGAIAGMMAGMVELAILGAIFALIGGRPEESILGAVGGLLVGLAVGVMGGRTSLALVANFGLVFGAITGATLRPYFRLLSLPVILVGRLLRRQQRPSVIAPGHDGRIEHRPFVPALHRQCASKPSRGRSESARSRTRRHSTGGEATLEQPTRSAERAGTASHCFETPNLPVSPMTLAPP